MALKQAKPYYKGKTQQPQSSLRKIMNITEEALAIGKVPCEDVARMIARG